MAHTELLPCPFCGNSKIGLYGPTHEIDDPYNPADRSFPIARCLNCYAEAAGQNDDRSAMKRRS